VTGTFLDAVLRGPAVDPDEDPCRGRTDLLVPMSRLRGLVDDAYAAGFANGQIRMGQHGMTIREVKRRAARAEIAAQGGNVSRAARVLDISRSSVYELMKERIDG